ncbi:MAG TPA: DUF1697 domain-containing protein [Gemmatimonadales bacterium]|nr:DUF1697 domain-containing protein [Gemmatimonadales bacterium]
MPRATACVALLRAVNLGPHNKVAMGDLRTVLEDLGLKEPRTLLQSGNVVFRTTRRPAATLERMLETETERRLGVRTEYHVRTAEEWRAVVAGNPFPAEARDDPSHLLVVFFKATLQVGAVAALRAAIAGRERVEAHAREAYIVYPDGIGRSKVTTALVEKTLGGRGTGRNWNTVLKLAELVG